MPKYPMVPGWLVVLLSVAVLDLAIYLQHVPFHAGSMVIATEMLPYRCDSMRE